MLSRGASRATLVERDRRAARALSASARELGLGDRTRVAALDLLRPPGTVAARLAALGEEPWSLVLADPPWAEAGRVPALLVALSESGALAPGALLVVEHAARRPLELPTGLASVTTYRYGDTAIAVVEPGDPR